MTESLTCYELDRSGREYFAQQLSKGKALSKAMLNSDRWRRGRFVTYLPPGTAKSALYQFEEGGKIPSGPAKRILFGEENLVAVPISTAYGVLENIIRNFLASSAGAVAIFEDAVSRAGDPALARRDTTVVKFGDTILHVLGHSDATDEARLSRTVKHSNSIWHFMVLMTNAKNTAWIPDDSELTVESVEELAAKAIKAAVGAYDGEGFVMWNE